MLELYKQFKKLISEQKRIVVATCLKDKPKTRIFPFVFDEQRKVFYFITMKDADFNREIIRNHNVCITTIPEYGKAHVRVFGLALKSNLKIYDIKTDFLNRNINDSVLLTTPHDQLQLYEVRVKNADVYDNNYQYQVLPLTV